MRLVDLSGEACAPVQPRSAEIPIERVNTGDTLKVGGNGYLGAGKPRLCEMAGAMMSISEEGILRLPHDRAFGAQNAKSTSVFQARCQAAFDAERADWEVRGEFDRLAELESEDGTGADATEVEIPEGCELVEAPFGGVVWKLEIGEGSSVETGQTVAVLEAMKMESPVPSPFGGKVRRIYVSERQQVAPGAPLFALEPAE